MSRRGTTSSHLARTLVVLAILHGGAEWLVAGRLHLLAIGDLSDPDIRRSVETDIVNMHSLFNNHVAGNDLNYVPLSRADLTPAQILEQIRSISVGPDDAVVVYFSGHGGFDPRRGQFLATSGGRLLRSRLLAEIRRTSPRLGVLMTDTCSNVVEGDQGGVAGVRLNNVTYPAFQSLFFESRGFVDLSGTSRGEYGWCDSRNGGYFTKVFTEHLRQVAAQRVTWEMLHVPLQHHLSAMLEKQGDAAAQTISLRTSQQPPGVVPAVPTTPLAP